MLSFIIRYLSLCMTFLLVCQATDQAIARQPSSINGEEDRYGLLKRSDILLSPRVYRPDWREAFTAFHATRIVWSYAGDRYLKDGMPRGATAQCSFPFFVPASHPSAGEMACLNSKGTPLSREFSKAASAAADTQDRTHTYADVSRPAWHEYMIEEIERLVDAGCRSFHQDDPWKNVSRIRQDGCHPPNASPQSDSDADSQEERQRDQVRRYHAWLHGHVRRYVAQQDPTTIPSFSANITSSQIASSTWIMHQFDFLISEMVGNRAQMLPNLRAFASITGSMAGVSAVTFFTDDVWINQRGIASSYALGLVPVAPWDVYIGPKKARYFGDPRDYTALFSMVRANPGMFDNFIAVSDEYNEYEIAIPFHGVVTQVDDTSHATQLEVSWTGGNHAKSIAKGTEVRIGAETYRIAAESKEGRILLARDAKVEVDDPVTLGTPDVLVAVRRSVRNPERVAIHVVNWREEAMPLWLDVRVDAPSPPRDLLLPGLGSSNREPERREGAWRYNVGIVETWAILGNVGLREEWQD